MAKEQNKVHGEPGCNNNGNQASRVCFGWYIINSVQALPPTVPKEEDLLNTAVSEANAELS